MPYFQLCDSIGINTREDCQITEFNISYYASNGMKDISVCGSNIPDSICLEIGIYSIDTQVFISKIKGLIGREEVRLNSMQFQITRKENE